MPTSLGGTNEVAETRLGPVSPHVLEAATAASPILRLSPAGSPYKPVAPVERRLSPPAAAEEPMLGPTTRSRHATIEAMAAHGKTKSGAKKKRQAAKRKKARSAAEAKPDSTSSAGGSEDADALTRASETVADAKSATGEEPVRTEDVKASKASREGDAIPGLVDASDSEEKGSGDEVMEALGGLRMHGPTSRDLSFRSSDSDRPSPKDEEVHMQAARANDAARAKAFAVLSSAESRFTLIGRALRKACNAKAPAVLADFPSVALGEAAAAFLHQLSGLNILHAPARIHTGKQQGVVTAFLGKLALRRARRGFDQ